MSSKNKPSEVESKRSTMKHRAEFGERLDEIDVAATARFHAKLIEKKSSTHQQHPRGAVEGAEGRRGGAGD